MRNRTTCAAVLVALILGSVVLAGDWPRFRGPEGNGHGNEEGLLTEWPEKGPPLQWTFTGAGTGFGTPSVVGDRIYILGSLGGTESVIALDTSGKKLWTSEIGSVYDFQGNVWSKGPNSAPTVDGDYLYGLGSQGILVCVEAKTGKQVWKRNLVKEMGAEVNGITSPEPKMGWGFSWSPIVDGDQLLITPGGEKGLVAALNKKTGKTIWQSGAIKDQCTYATPTIATIHGQKQYVVMTQDGVVGVDPQTGNQLWRQKNTRPYRDVVCVTPIVSDNTIFITATRGTSGLVEITKGADGYSAKLTKQGRRLSNLHGGYVKVGKNVYGCYELSYWRCFDFTTLKSSWETQRTQLKAGSLCYADGHLYCVSQNDETVALVEATPEKFVVKGKFVLPKVSKLRKSNGKMWTHPVVANGMLYLRDQENLYCYKIKK